MSEAAVLVVAYRNPEQLAACLDAVAEHLPNAPVLVHDNSGDHAAELDDLAATRPSVTWRRGGPNIGFAAAVNALAAEVPEHDLVLMNPDAVLTGPLTKTLAAVAEPGVAVAAPLDAEPADGRPWDTAHRDRGLVRSWVSAAGYAPRLRLTPWSDLYAAAPDRDVEGYLTGACLAIARQAWDEVGPFDEEFFLYSEESDWQRRAREAGWRLRLVDEPGVVHAAGGTVSSDPHGRRRSHDLLRANVALELQRRSGSASTGDRYLAGVTVLDHLQRSKRQERRALPRSDRPTVTFTINRLVYGGAERHHVVLGTELARRGHDVTIVCLQRLGPLIRDVPHEVRVVRQPWWAPDTGQPDGPAVLVTGDTNTETGFGALWRRRRRDRRWLVGAHVPPDPGGPTYSGALARAMRRADGFVALSPQHRIELEAHQDVARQWFIAPNGVAHATDLTDVPARSMGVPPRLVMLSRIVELKNPHLLVEALDGLRDLPWTLDIYGDGPDRERLEALTPPDLLDRVRWRGWSPGPEAAMADADVVLLPSRSEAFPLTILEAMARRLPVIASASCAVPDMLDHGSAGIVVDDVSVTGWRSALREVLTDPGRLDGLGDRGLARMREHYTIEAMADAYEAALAEVWR